MPVQTQQWIDISIPMKSGMVHWPDNPPVMIERLADKNTDLGAPCNISGMALGTHTGTHMDAPLHFKPQGKSMDQLPLDAVIGPARVIEIQNETIIPVDELRAVNIQPGERLLFKTKNSDRCWSTLEFIEDFVYIPLETAEFLTQKQVMTIGVDYLSVGGYKKDGRAVHHELLGSEVWIIEGLNLAQIAPGDYDMICLPLPIEGGDGAPARAVIRKRIS